MSDNSKLFGFDPDLVIPDYPSIKDKSAALKSLVLSPMLESDVLLELLSGKMHFMSENNLQHLLCEVDADLTLCNEQLEERNLEGLRENETFQSIIEKLLNIEKATNEPLIFSDFIAVSEEFSIKLNDILTIAKRFDVINPRSLYEYISRWVYGNHEAKQAISSVIYNHALRNSLFGETFEAPKNNILLIGESGTGKSFLIETACQVLDIPNISVDASAMVKTGIIGNNINDCLTTLLLKYEDINLAQRAIIFLDEIDKVQPSIADQLLTMIQGTKLMIGESLNHQNRNHVPFETYNITFILAGSFSNGLADIIKKRLGIRQIGFGSAKPSASSILKQVQSSDIVAYGLPRELVGRIQTIASMSPLSSSQLEDLILNSKDSVYIKWVEYFKYHDIELQIEKPAINLIAQLIYESKNGMGARTLNKALSLLLNDYIFDIANYRFSTIFITREEVNRKLPNIL